MDRCFPGGGERALDLLQILTGWPLPTGPAETQFRVILSFGALGPLPLVLLTCLLLLRPGRPRTSAPAPPRARAQAFVGSSRAHKLRRQSERGDLPDRYSVLNAGKRNG